MAYLIDLETHTDVRENLTVIENVLPFSIKRFFYIYGVDKSKEDGIGIIKQFRRLYAFRVNVKYLVMMLITFRFSIWINLQNAFFLNRKTGIRCMIFSTMQY
jgi:hypothetical protein